TVVRAVRATAAKPGAKALVTAEGIVAGWIGGGCAAAAVLRAARAALADGRPRLVSVRPEDELARDGAAWGEEREGVLVAANLCPSRGTLDVFVEPVLPPPELVLFGASPVALATAELALRLGYRVRVAAEDPAAAGFPAEVAPLDAAAPSPALRFVLVATQGRGDRAALEQAIAIPARWHGFVGSRAKLAALARVLDRPDLSERVECPAGLPIGAIEPEEIALSILARLVELRRASRRDLAPTF
ncbi:MAG: XdhC/CoxI family protein, partial [Geminicoccaceae bacterium]|nr:XdhC/CoxI family protein [Geminicoccaceae bacterium]